MIKDSVLLAMCNDIAQNSKCLSRKIGAVLVKDNTIISTGVNGPPRKIPHCNERHRYDEKLMEELIKKDFLKKADKNFIDNFWTCPRQLLGFKSGEGLEWCVAGHAERNALINCARNGISTIGTKMYMSCGVPCTPCLVEIINAGVEEIIVKDLTFYDLSGEYLLKNSNLKWRLFNL